MNLRDSSAERGERKVPQPPDDPGVMPGSLTFPVDRFPIPSRSESVSGFTCPRAPLQGCLRVS